MTTQSPNPAGQSRLPRNADDRRRPGEPPIRELRPNLSPFDLAQLVRERLYADRDYARLRRNEWRSRASSVHLLTLAVGAAATIVLGLSDLSTGAAVGFGLTASLTFLNAIEPFYNWRSRWVAVEEALAQWHAIEEDLEIYVAATGQDALSADRLLETDRQRRDVWANFSDQWIRDRRGMSQAESH